MFRRRRCKVCPVHYRHLTLHSLVTCRWNSESLYRESSVQVVAKDDDCGIVLQVRTITAHNVALD